MITSIDLSQVIFTPDMLTALKLLKHRCKHVLQGWIGDAGTHVPMHVCPPAWLNEARTNIGLSPTMGTDLVQKATD